MLVVWVNLTKLSVSEFCTFDRYFWLVKYFFINSLLKIKLTLCALTVPLGSIVRVVKTIDCPILSPKIVYLGLYSML